MEEKELKTSPKQRLFIIAIAVIMLGSIIASYAAIVIAGGNSSSAASAEVDEAKVAEYKAAYEEKQAKFTEKAAKDYEKFIKYKNDNVKAYNETSANEHGVQTKDLAEGTGREIGEDDADYLAYYVGWCADGTIFDSSFNDNTNPTGFAKILDASLGMIEGWTIGVEGMKLEGVRVITIPGELAYGETMEICGGTNKPLKFMIMAKEKGGELGELASELDAAYMQYQSALYGLSAQ